MLLSERMFFPQTESTAVALCWSPPGHPALVRLGRFRVPTIAELNTIASSASYSLALYQIHGNKCAFQASMQLISISVLWPERRSFTWNVDDILQCKAGRPCGLPSERVMGFKTFHMMNQ